MSTIKLPALPPMPTERYVGLKQFTNWDMQDYATAYAEEAVRQALAAQVARINTAMASMSMDGVNGGAVQKEYFKAGARRAIQAVNGALIPENSNGEST